MKKLLILFIPLVIFFSCELFNEGENDNLDSNLFGTFKGEFAYLNTLSLTAYIGEFWYNFNQNGTYEYFAPPHSVTCPHNPAPTGDGDWSVEGGFLSISGFDDDEIYSLEYDILGDTLRFYQEYPCLILSGGTIIQEEGDPPFYQIYIKQ